MDKGKSTLTVSKIINEDNPLIIRGRKLSDHQTRRNKIIIDSTNFDSITPGKKKI